MILLELTFYVVMILLAILYEFYIWKKCEVEKKWLMVRPMFCWNIVTIAWHSYMSYNIIVGVM
jgi:hypothetical protein